MRGGQCRDAKCHLEMQNSALASNENHLWSFSKSSHPSHTNPVQLSSLQPGARNAVSETAPTECKHTTTADSQTPEVGVMVKARGNRANRGRGVSVIVLILTIKKVNNKIKNEDNTDK